MFSSVFEVAPVSIVAHSPSYFFRFIVTVTAYNNASQAESLPVEIMVMSKVKMLEVRCLNDSLVNRSLEFGAFSYSGSHLTYKWDFGDGSPPLYTTAREPQASHTYVKLVNLHISSIRIHHSSSIVKLMKLHVKLVNLQQATRFSCC